jgi:hypothetical protein
MMGQPEKPSKKLMKLGLMLEPLKVMEAKPRQDKPGRELTIFEVIGAAEAMRKDGKVRYPF